MKSKIKFLGIDIGGAHIKLVGLNEKKELIFVDYIKFYFWKEEKSINKVFNYINSKSNKNTLSGITMTAELCDIFKNRLDGFRKIYNYCKKLKNDYFFYTKSKKKIFKKTDYSEIVSMNWHSIGRLLERQLKNAIIVDFGSTTTDIICVKNHIIQNKNFDDFSRINSNELVYTGLTRTPIFAIDKKVRINRKYFEIIPEFFSDMSDVYRINSILKKQFDIDETADGKRRSKFSSYARLSRNFGLDFKKSNQNLIKDLSKEIIKTQLEKIYLAIKKNRAKYKIEKKSEIIVCGIGKDVLSDFLNLKKEQVIQFSDLVKCSKQNLKTKAAFHTPAFCIASLLSELK